MRNHKTKTNIWSAQIKEIAIVGPLICLGIGQYFARIFGHKGAACNAAQSLHAPSLGGRCAAHNLQCQPQSILNDTIFAQQFIAATNVVAFEYHGRIVEIKFHIQSAVTVVPIFHGKFIALTLICGATVGEGKAKKSFFYKILLNFHVKNTNLSEQAQMHICEIRWSIWMEFRSTIDLVMYLKRGTSESSNWCDSLIALIGYRSRPFDMSLMKLKKN